MRHDGGVLSAYLILTAATTARPALLAPATPAMPAMAPAVVGGPSTQAFGMGSAALVLVTVFVAVFALMVFVGGIREDRRRRRRR